MSEFEVAIKIAGKLDKSLQTSVSSAQKMLGSLGKGGLSSALTGIGNVMESTGKALTTGVTMPVIALGATSVKEFGSVDKSMKLVQATMGSTDAQAKQLESTMKKAAANSVFGMQDAADATLNFARQGFNAKQAGDMLTPALNLAAGTATDLSVVTGGLGNALKMFGKDSNYAATAADILSTAQAQANTTVTDLFDAMATAGPICSSVGWSMSDLAAITDIFGDAGISGAEGATALKTGLARLASPAKDGTTWIKKLGLEIFNSDGSMKSMVDVQKQLHDSFQGLTSQEQMSAAAAIFGKNQMAKWMTLINASPDQVQKYASSLEGAAGSSQKMADALLSGMGGSLEKLNSSFDVMKYTVGGIASEVLKPFVDNLTGLIDKFNNLDPSMQKNIVKWVGIAAAAGPVLLIGGRLFKVAGSLVGTFGKVGKAIGSIGKKTKGMSAPLKEGSSVMSAAAKNALGFGIGFAAAAAGVWILVKAAKELAAAGPGAQIATVLMAGGIIALMAVAGALGPALTAASVGLIAFGASIVLAATGCLIMVQAATQIASAGPAAQIALALLAAGLIAFGAIAGALAPILLAGAAAIAALGAALTLVATAAMLGAAALAIISVSLPLLSTYGATGASAILTLSGALTAFAASAAVCGAGALVAAAGLLAMAAGATAGGAALLILAAGALAASVGMVPLAAALALAAASVEIIGASAKAAGSALKSMAKGATGTAAKMAIIAAGAAPLAAALAPLAVAAAAAAAAVLALAAGSTAAAAAIMLLAAGITMTAGALTLCSASITAFKASAAGINAVATPTAAAFTRMAVAVAPFTAAIIALAGPMMATSASMVVFAGGITVAAASATALAVSLRSTMATLGTLGALTTVAMNMVTVAIRNSMMQSNQAVVTGITVMRTTTQTGMTTIVAVTRNGMTMFVVAVRTGGNQAVAACRSTSSQMVGAFSGLSGSMYSAGSFAMAGLRNGIAAGGAAAIAQARSIANQVAATVNSALKIHSPSRVLDQSGQYAGQGLAGGIQKTGALVQKAANESLAQPVMNAGSKTLEAPQFENRSSVIGDTVSAFSGQKQSGNGNSNEPASQQFVFSPTYRFEAGTPSKEDMVEANRMSQAEFKKMMKEYLRTEGRRAFA